MRIALGVSYNARSYNGWQSQPNGNTVQDKLEAALGRFATQSVSTLCAGRTDAGVHGLMQVVHFDTDIVRPENAWVRGTNTFLPPDIAVQWARHVPDAFHSRACAASRRYAYVLLQSPVRPSVETGRVGWVLPWRFSSVYADGSALSTENRKRREAAASLPQRTGNYSSSTS